MVYTWSVLEILKSATFTKWFTGLRDRQARARIDARIARLRQGNHGDAKPLKGTGGVYELRIDYGPGYRVRDGKDLEGVIDGNQTTQRDLHPLGPGG